MDLPDADDTTITSLRPIQPGIAHFSSVLPDPWSPSTLGKCSRSFDRARRRPACDASSLIAPVDFRAPIRDNVEGHLGAFD
jgi:hypothetical protein